MQIVYLSPKNTFCSSFQSKVGDPVMKVVNLLQLSKNKPSLSKILRLFP